VVNNAARRVAVAHADLSSAELVLLDEPTACLDPDEAAAVVGAARAATAGLSVLVVTHDYQLAAGVDRCVPLEPVSHDPEPRHRRTPPGPAVATPMPVLSPSEGGDDVLRIKTPVRRQTRTGTRPRSGSGG
jgi:energy-coupling factor transporter ATP-binding protein EcfA2